jgi:hypothetical protein
MLGMAKLVSTQTLLLQTVAPGPVLPLPLPALPLRLLSPFVPEPLLWPVAQGRPGYLPTEPTCEEGLNSEAGVGEKYWASDRLLVTRRKVGGTEGRK